jgi:SHS2 domain-containing protein
MLNVSTLKMEAGEFSKSLLYFYITEDGNVEDSPRFFFYKFRERTEVRGYEITAVVAGNNL